MLHLIGFQGHPEVCGSLILAQKHGWSHARLQELSVWAKSPECEVVFAAAVGSGHEMGLDGVYNRLGLTMEGTHHRGDDDAWNIAGVLCRLLRAMRNVGDLK